MTRPETSTGGLKGQLQSLALRASVNEYWRRPVPQTVSLKRTVYVPGTIDIELTTQFEAHRKRPVGMVEGALQTFYTVRAIETQNEMLFEELPPNVQQNFMSIANTHTEVVETIRMSRDGEDESETEQLVDDDVDYDDERFRFEKMVEYRLNGNARLFGVNRYVRYLQIDEDGGEDELFDDAEYEAGDPRNSQEAAYSLTRWPSIEVPTERSVPFGFSHPDLIDIEHQADRASLGEDLQFLECINGYTHNVELREDTRRERIQAIMSILAFTTLNGTVDDVRKHI